MRCFVAVDLDPNLTGKIENIQKELQDFDVKMVELYNLHLTLKFLDDIDEKMIKKVKTYLEEISKNLTPFDIEIKTIGVFPNDKLVRVIWVGASALSSLQIAINNVLSTYFKKEKPSPHITIARVRSQNHRKEIIEFVSSHRDYSLGKMPVNVIKLKKSTVTSKGPIYEDLAVFRLGA